MKKSLIALAVLAASGAAFAQSTVTIYGLLDVNINSTKDQITGTGQSQVKIDSGGVQTSRFGLKGSEDLGGGLKANFKLESGFDIDTGRASGYSNPYNPTAPPAASVFSRQSWVGVSGDFGEIQLGKMWTPYDDQTGTGLAAFYANTFSPVRYIWSSYLNYYDRPGNAIQYTTPNFGGISGAVMYSFGENKTATTGAGNITSFRIGYEGGPIAVSLGYQAEKTPNGAAKTAKFTQLNGTYDLGVAKILAAYGNVKDFGGTPKTNEYHIGVDVPLGSALTLSGGYATSKDTGFAPGTSEIKRNGFGLGALYALSKRTNLYAGLNNSKQTQAGTADLKTNVYALGVRHTF